MLKLFHAGEKLVGMLPKLNAMVKAIRNVAKFGGDGVVTVKQVPEAGYALGINIQALNERLPKWVLKWGKATADWTSGNTITLDPCDTEGVDNGRPDVTAYAFTPTSIAPGDGAVALAIAKDDILAYLSYGDKLGVLVNPPVAARGGMFAVKCWKDGGADQGTDTTQCDYTYKVRTIDATAHDAGGTVLGNAMSPECRTQASNWQGKLDFPPQGTGTGWIGLGYYDADDVFHLWDAGERPYTKACP